MKALSLSGAGQHPGLALLIVRVIAGVIMLAHGWSKLSGGPASFGENLAGLGVPAPVFMGYVVTFTEVVGGALLILGLLSRLAALALTVDLVMAILLVKVKIGLIAPMNGGTGAELDLALIAGFVTVLLLGPGSISVDRALGIDGGPGDAPVGTQTAAADPG